MILCIVNAGSVDLLVVDVVLIFKRKQVSTNDLWWKQMQIDLQCRYTLFNKNQAAWYFVHPAQAVMWGTVAIIIWVVLLYPYLWMCDVSVSSIH